MALVQSVWGDTVHGGTGSTPTAAQHQVDATFLSSSNFFLDIKNHSTILVVYERLTALSMLTHLLLLLLLLSY